MRISQSTPFPTVIQKITIDIQKMPILIQKTAIDKELKFSEN